jgi:hypothetical protein
VRVDGEGVIERFVWQTNAGHSMHLLNYTNQASPHEWQRRVNSRSIFALFVSSEPSCLLFQSVFFPHAVRD